MRFSIQFLALFMLTAFFVSDASAECGGDFSLWLEGIRADARRAGIRDSTLVLLDGLRPNGKVLALDGSQRVFTQTWLKFSGRMVNPHRLKAGRTHLEKYADVFARAEDLYGVPGPVVAAFWGLETDYGAVQGKFNTLRALATLAHDCRRPRLFRPQLIDALRLVDGGYLAPGDLVGAWAGELGQIQMLPSDYLALGTDGDGDGRVDLRRSKPDVIMTGARHLARLGWRRGQPWLLEVRVPEELPWEHAGAYKRIPQGQWAAWGVRDPSGADLPDEFLRASLLLPMGRKGPAFLAYPNFHVFLKWNQSLVYSTTAAYFATRLAGAKKVRSGRPERGLSFDKMKRLQQELGARGYDVGEIDGVLGARTRDAVRREQIRLGLPADSWPTPRLLSRLVEAGKSNRAEKAQRAP
jgi:lytic murein transglycosylase